MNNSKDMGAFRPRVLYLPRWYPSDLDPQLGVFIAKHAQALAKLTDVAVLYPVPDPGLKKGYKLQHTKSQGVDTLIVYYAPASIDSPIHGWLAILSYLKASFVGWRIIKKEWGIPDIFHAHVLLRPLVFAAFLGFYYRRPFVVSEHWTGYVFGFFDAKPNTYKWIARFLVKKAACLTLVSESLRNAMISNGFKNKRIEIIANVVEVGDSCDERSLGKDKPLMLTVADLVERNKNVSGIIMAVNQLIRDGASIEYHIIGGGEDQDTLKQLASDLGLIGVSIFFHGRKDNAYVLQFIRKCDFLVVNSNVETFSVAAAESLACGKPVIATICGGPEFFINEEVGVLIEPGNQAQLEDAIRYMLVHHHDYDPRILRKMIEDKFSPSAIGEQFISIYSRVLHSGNYV